MNMGKTMAVTDAIDALVAEAYRRMRDAGLSHVEAAECLKRWEGVETASDFQKAIDVLLRKVDEFCDKHE